MNRATTSLPVPDSPVTSTVVSVSATCVAFFNTSRHSADSPTTPVCVRALRDSEAIRGCRSSSRVRALPLPGTRIALARRSRETATAM